jgi:hypothetical protein
LAHVAGELVDRFATLVAFRRFHAMGVAGCRLLRSNTLSACNISFVDPLVFATKWKCGNVLQEFV